MRSSIREFATFDWGRFRQARLPLVGVGVILFFILLAAFAPYIVSDPTQIEMRREQDGQTITPPYPPSLRNLFGTDQLGRDIFARVVFGLRTSLIVGILVRGLSMVAGTLLGLISGYFPRIVDDVIMRITDIMLAFPVILLAMTVTAVLGPGLVTVCRGSGTRGVARRRPPGAGPGPCCQGTDICRSGALLGRRKLAHPASARVAQLHGADYRRLFDGDSRRDHV